MAIKKVNNEKCFSLVCSCKTFSEIAVKFIRYLDNLYWLLFVVRIKYFIKML